MWKTGFLLFLRPVCRTLIYFYLKRTPRVLLLVLAERRWISMNNSAASDTGVRCLCMYWCVSSVFTWQATWNKNVYWISGKLTICYELSCSFCWEIYKSFKQRQDSFCQYRKEPAFSILDVSKWKCPKWYCTKNLSRNNTSCYKFQTYYKIRSGKSFEKQSKL